MIKKIDKVVCDWSMNIGPSLTEKQQASLVAAFFNELFSDKNVHTMPADGLHIESKECWCCPVCTYKPDDKNDVTEHWSHNDTRVGGLQ